MYLFILSNQDVPLTLGDRKSNYSYITHIFLQLRFTKINSSKSLREHACDVTTSHLCKEVNVH